jgi:hypothetical protein
MKEKSQRVRGQHYIPRFYLNEFASPDSSDEREGRLWVFDKNNPSIRKQKSIKIARKNNLYTIIHSGGIDFSLENMLGNTESDAAPIFKRIRSSSAPPLDTEERYLLARFISFLAFRTPQFKKHLNVIVQNIVKSHAVEEINNRGGIPTLLRELQSSIGIEVSPEKFISVFNSIKLQPPEGTFQLLMIKAAERMIPYLCSMNWSFLRCTGKCHFITSDSPVIMSNPNVKDLHFRYGYRQKEVEIIFPINRELCLLAFWSGKAFDSMIDGDRVSAINSSIANYAERYLFSPLFFKFVPFGMGR